MIKVDSFKPKRKNAIIVVIFMVTFFSVTTYFPLALNNRLPLSVYRSSSPISLESHDELFIQKLTYVVQLTTSSTASTNIELIIQNQGQSTLSSVGLWVNGSFSTFFAYDAFGDLLLSWQPTSQYTHFLNITLRTPLSANQSLIFFVQCLWELTILENNDPVYYQVELPVFLPYETEWLVFQLSLPSGYGLIDDPFRINPTSGSIQVNGDITLISWFLTSNTITYGEPIFFLAKYHQLSSDDTTDSENATNEKVSFSWLAYSLGGLTGTIITLGIVAFYLLMKQPKERKEKAEFVQMLLGKDEISLLRLLEENEGRLPQRDLEELTDFSRSKISRHLSLLEEKGLVRKKRFGRTNRIYLTESAREHMTSNMIQEEKEEEE